MIMRFPGGLGKALTLSYDDGVEQDVRLIRIMDQYGIRGTFNINSGCYAPEETVWPAGQIHRRMTRSALLDTYDTSKHEVAVHCLTHASLTELPADQIIHEVATDRENLERDFGGIIRGMAYPYGSCSAQVADTLRACGILYSRTVTSTHDFHVPQDWLLLNPTCHHNDPMLMELADRFLADDAGWVSRLFYLWGHAYEFEANNNWELIEQFCAKMGGRSDIWYATNIEICAYTLAFRKLAFSADGKRVYNPTAQTLWLEEKGKTYSVKPGETASLA